MQATFLCVSSSISQKKPWMTASRRPWPPSWRSRAATTRLLSTCCRCTSEFDAINEQGARLRLVSLDFPYTVPLTGDQFEWFINVIRGEVIVNDWQFSMMAYRPSPIDSSPQRIGHQFRCLVDSSTNPCRPLLGSWMLP